MHEGLWEINPPSMGVGLFMVSISQQNINLITQNSYPIKEDKMTTVPEIMNFCSLRLGSCTNGGIYAVTKW